MIVERYLLAHLDELRFRCIIAHIPMKWCFHSGARPQVLAQDTNSTAVRITSSALSVVQTLVANSGWEAPRWIFDYMKKFWGILHHIKQAFQIYSSQKTWIHPLICVKTSRLSSPSFSQADFLEPRATRPEYPRHWRKNDSSSLQR